MFPFGIAQYGPYLSPNCYAHWCMNESSGTNVPDTSGNSRNGTTTGTPLWVAGKLNNCLQFNGTTQYADCGNIASFERIDKFSLECWFKTLGVTEYLMSKFTTGFVGYGVTLNATGQVVFALYATGNIQRITTVSYNDNIFHHLILTYDGSSNVSGMKIYIDGALASSTSSGTTIAGTLTNATAFRMATREGLVFLFSGLIDEMVIYNKELTLQDVLFRYNGGSGTELLN